MSERDYERICYLTQQREEHVPLRNKVTSVVGFSMGCTYEGGTVQVRLENGERDSWAHEECVEIGAADTTH